MRTILLLFLYGMITPFFYKFHKIRTTFENNLIDCKINA